MKYLFWQEELPLTWQREAQGTPRGHRSISLIMHLRSIGRKVQRGLCSWRSTGASMPTRHAHHASFSPVWRSSLAATTGARQQQTAPLEDCLPRGDKSQRPRPRLKTARPSFVAARPRRQLLAASCSSFPSWTVSPVWVVPVRPSSRRFALSSSAFDHGGYSNTVSVGDSVATPQG